MHTISRFQHLCQHIPRRAFQTYVQQHQADKYAKTLRCWDMLILLIYGHTQQSPSLRQMVQGFNLYSNHHYHLNTSSAKRSTVSQALAKRPVEPFKQLFEHLMSSVSRTQRKQLDKLAFALDSTPISLLSSRHNSWTEENRTLTTKGLKLHVLMNLATHLPVYANITHPNVNDVTDAQSMTWEKGATYVEDKGYCDYNLWKKIDDAGAFFVTRLKKKAAIDVINSTSHTAENILADQTIHLTNYKPRGGKLNNYANHDLRRVIVHKDGENNPWQLVTNDFSSSAQEIAQLYKNRWQIELLFKWLKQNLKLRRYFGTSENAVRIQIYVALISYVLMHLVKRQGCYKGGLLEVMLQLRFGAFQRVANEENYYRRRRQRAKIVAERQNQLVLSF